MENKFVALIDMDCFYCQVESRLNPSLLGKPLAVVQYNQWRGGGIIAVNYEARKYGVKRGLRGDDARQKCPEIELVSTREVRGKADLSDYRNASREVIDVLASFCSHIEKASIDEAYLDLTNLIKCDCLQHNTDGDDDDELIIGNLQSTFVVGYDSSSEGTQKWLDDLSQHHYWKHLAKAAVLVEKIRAAVFEKTSFRCSAGISHNKMLAKLACGIHKPNKQTVLPFSSVPSFFNKLPVKQIRNLGGKLGDAILGQLNVTTIGEITRFTLSELQNKFGTKHGSWLHEIANGIDREPVKTRTVCQSIGCCKNFKGPSTLTIKDDVKHWLSELCNEIYDRLQQDVIVNKRKATLLTVTAHQNGTTGSGIVSKSCPLHAYDLDNMINMSFSLAQKFNNCSAQSPSWNPSLAYLGVSVSKFINITGDGGRSLLDFFKPFQPTNRKNNHVENESVDSDTISNKRYDIENDAIQSTETPESNTSSVEANTDDNCATDPVISADDQCDRNYPLFNYDRSFFCQYFQRKRTIQLEDNVKASTSSVVADNSSSSVEQTAFSVNDQIVNEPESKICKTDDVMKIEPPIEHAVLANEQSEFVVQQRCPQCSQLIEVNQFEEHLDYHVAVRLQNEINGEEVRVDNATSASHRMPKMQAQPPASSLSSLSSSRHKRESKNKRMGSDGTGRNGSKVGTRTIESFLIPKSLTNQNR